MGHNSLSVAMTENPYRTQVCRGRKEGQKEGQGEENRKNKKDKKGQRERGKINVVLKHLLILAKEKTAVLS